MNVLLLLLLLRLCNQAGAMAWHGHSILFLPARWASSALLCMAAPAPDAARSLRSLAGGRRSLALAQMAASSASSRAMASS